MRLTPVEINAAPHLRREAKALYLQAFPPEERLPWWLLRLNACRKDIGLTAWLDAGVFCGFTASVTVGKLHFLLFLAVEQSLRGKGCGSAILSAVKEANDTVVLNVEPLLPEAPNYPQRQRRFAFYRKNGFFDTGWHVWEVGGKFRVLSTRQQLDEAAYKKLFKKLSCGFWNVRLEPADTQ